MRTTFAQVKASRIPKTLGLCSTDARVKEYVNEAQQRLLSRGKWWGTYGRYQICTNDACLTWPRQIAAIEACAVCDQPIQVRNEWYEFLSNGPGLQDADNGSLKLVDRGTAVTFDDVQGSNSILRVYADIAGDAGAKILIQGYDKNGQWIRTLDSGVHIDGEYITLISGGLGYAVSVNTFSTITGVIKPVTMGNVRVYEYNQDTGGLRALATYEPDEEVPNYRRSLIVNLANQSTCSDSQSGCGKKNVTVMAKLEFIPVKNDNDFLLIGNIPALKLACLAIVKEENNLFDEAGKYMAMAIVELQKELGHYLGDGEVIQIRTESKWTFGAGAVENPVGYYGA